MTERTNTSTLCCLRLLSGSILVRGLWCALYCSLSYMYSVHSCSKWLPCGLIREDGSRLCKAFSKGPSCNSFARWQHEHAEIQTKGNESPTLRLYHPDQLRFKSDSIIREHILSGQTEEKMDFALNWTFYGDELVQLFIFQWQTAATNLHPCALAARLTHYGIKVKLCS